MAKSNVTKKQRKLVAELRYLLSTLALDPAAIIANDDPEAWTTRLELAKDQIIRSAIILKYVLIDEFLSAAICWQYFGKKRSFQQLWRTKRFQLFNYFVLEKLYFLQKLDIVKSLHEIPRWVLSDLGALNELRNGIAHSFFPENRRRKPEWKGQNVFTRDGFERFLNDVGKITDFFLQRFWRGSPEDTDGRPGGALAEGGAAGE